MTFRDVVLCVVMRIGSRFGSGSLLSLYRGVRVGMVEFAFGLGSVGL